MSAPFERLLETTIEYLTELKRNGVPHVSVSPETRAWLANPPPPLPTSHEAPDPAEPAAAATAPPPADLPAVDKTTAFEELRGRALVCVKCPHLAASRRNVVFGVGDTNAQLMFVGEAPGADEDAAGEPFVGKAGQLLTRIIETMGFTRQSVYIANILKCRPDTPNQRYGNRKPTADEMKTCLPYLLAQINLIQPKAIVALGVTAMEGLFGAPTSISRARGNWHDLNGVPVMPTFHPAYLLRDQSLSEKRKVWDDMLLVLERLGMPISEKQRSYFTSPAEPAGR